MKKNLLNLSVLMFLVTQSMAQEHDLREADILKLDCQYMVLNEWDKGFTGVIQLTNIGTTGVDGWEVSWELSSNHLSNTWNAVVEAVQLANGKTLYHAKNLDWNDKIDVEQTIEFGFQGDKQGEELEVANITGSLCEKFNHEK